MLLLMQPLMTYLCANWYSRACSLDSKESGMWQPFEMQEAACGLLHSAKGEIEYFYRGRTIQSVACDTPLLHTYSDILNNNFIPMNIVKTCYREAFLY